jgi:hypothetical protein
VTEAAPPQTGTFEKLLAESRDLFTARLGAALGAMLDKADETLTTLITESKDREAQAVLQETRKLLGVERKKLEVGFQKAYGKEFSARGMTAGGSADKFSDLARSLTLVGDDDLEEALKFKDLATKLRRYCDEELVALDQRVGVLLGDANLVADANPFSPEAVCFSYLQACHETTADARVRGVLRALFDDHVMDAFRAIYKALNALLVKNGILPTIRYRATKSKDTTGNLSRKKLARKARGEEEDDEDEVDSADAGANLFAMLQKLVVSNAGAAGLAVGVAPGLAPGQQVLQGAELLGSLTRIQKGDVAGVGGELTGIALAAGGAGTAGAETANVLRELKSSSFGAGMGQMDAMTLDIVAMLFDVLFDDPKVPIALKGLVGRLQIPLLKVAIADKAFFAKKTHPARTMLDAFGEVALRLPPDFAPEHPLFVKLEAIVQYVVDGFQDDVAVFESVDQQLHNVIAEEDVRVAVEARAVTEQAEQAENLAVAKSAAEDEVRSRVQTRPLPGPVVDFFAQHWLHLLLLLHARQGIESLEWQDAIAVMDDMIWSLEARPTPEDRRKLAALVPGLLKRISAGLQTIEAPEEARAALFAELMKVHTEILHPKPKDAAAPNSVTPLVDEPSGPATLDFTAPVTVRNPYGEGKVQVSAPSTRSEPPANLEVGDWVEFRPKDGGPPFPKKLLFHTPKRSAYIFSERNGKEMINLSRQELVRRLRTSEMVRLDQAPEEPLFDRILNGLVGKLKGAPAAQPA